MQQRIAIEKSSSGVSFLTVLGLVFIVLKLVGVDPIVHWSWWVVTAPIWLPFAVIFGIIFMVLVARLIVTFCNQVWK